jgi:hypothetical protein
MATFIDLDSVWRDRVAYPNPCDYELTPSQILTWTKSSREVRAISANPNERPLDFVNSINLIFLTLPYPRIELFALSSIIVTTINGTTLTSSVAHNLSVGDIVMTSSAAYSTNGVIRNTEYHVVATPTPTTFQVSLLPAGAPVAFTNGTGLNMLLSVITATDYTTVMTQLDNALQLLQFPRLYVDFHSRRYNDTKLIKTNGGVLSDAKFIVILDRIQLDDNATPIWIHYRSHGEQVYRFKRDDSVVFRIMTRDGTTIPFFTEPDLTIPTNPSKQTLVTFSVLPYIKDASYINSLVDPIAP